MVFWRLSPPRYSDDYDAIYINGIGEHSHQLPWIQCAACEQSWGSSRVLPHPLPPSIVKRVELETAPLDPAPHRELCAAVEKAFGDEGVHVRVQPGDAFSPLRVRLPTFPTADFLWPSVGGPIVSARVHDALKEHKIRGAALCEVMWQRLGSTPPTLPAPLPPDGETESLIDVGTRYAEGMPAPEYFELVPTAASKLPPGVVLREVCEACGREDLDLHNRYFGIGQEHWNGEDVFMLATTLHVVVTDDVKRLLEKERSTNVDFFRLPAPA